MGGMGGMGGMVGIFRHLCLVVEEGESGRAAPSLALVTAAEAGLVMLAGKQWK